MDELLSAGALCRSVLASEVLGTGFPKWKQEVTKTKRCPVEMPLGTEKVRRSKPRIAG